MKATLPLILLLLFPALVSAQARTGIGLGFGGLKAFAEKWDAAKVITLNADFRIQKKTALKFSLGINSLSEHVTVVSSPANSYSTGGMFFITLEGKYYIRDNWFASAGMMGFMAGDYYGGYGPTMSFGYRDNLNKHWSIEIAPVVNFLKRDRRATIVAVAGFGLSLYYSSALKK